MMKNFEDFDYKDLKKFREQLGCSFRKFGAILNYSKTRLNQIENKKQELSHRLIIELKRSFPNKR